MKALLTVIVASVLASAIFAQTQESDPRYQQLLKAEAAWDEAEANHDSKALAEILAPEFVSIHEDGSISTLQEAQKGAPAQAGHGAAHKVEKRVIKIQGDIATLTGVYTEVGQTPRGYYKVTYNIADVYRYQGGRWRGLVGYGHVVSSKSGQAQPQSLND